MDSSEYYYCHWILLCIIYIDRACHVLLRLTHLPLVPHICVRELGSISSDNGLSPVQRQAITWTNADLLSIGLLGANFSEIWIQIQSSSFMKRHMKMSSAKWQPFCPAGDEVFCCTPTTLDHTNNYVITTIMFLINTDAWTKWLPFNCTRTFKKHFDWKFSCLD